MCREVVAALLNEPKNENKTKAEERQPRTRDARERRCLTFRCRPPALSHLPAAPACPGRRPASEQRAGEAGEAGESQERKAREGKAHTQRRAARRRRRARSAAQTSCNGRITAARAAGCLWWPWRCYASPSPLCSPLNSCWTQTFTAQLHAEVRVCTYTHPVLQSR